MDSGCWLGERAQHVGNPGGRVTQVPADGGAFLISDLTAQDGDYLVIHLLRPEVA